MHPTPRASTRRARPRALGGLALLGVVALLGACASGAGPAGAGDAGSTTPTDDDAESGPTPGELVLEPGSTIVGLPDGLGPQAGDAQAGVARTADPGLLYVITFGSSTCPAVPDDAAEDAGAGAVTITFPEPGDGPCTMDYVPATTVVGLPDGVGADGDLAVTVGTLGQVTLPAGSDEVVWSIATG